MPPAQPVIDFTEVESGIFEGLRTGEGVYILQNLAAARSLAKSMDQMIGDWAMVRGNGQAICGLTLTNTEAGQRQFPGLPEAEMRSGRRGVRADAMAARSRPDAADVGQGRDLAVRGRRQRAMAAGARQRRSADHVRGSSLRRFSRPIRAIFPDTGAKFLRNACRSAPARSSIPIARQFCGDRCRGSPQQEFFDALHVHRHLAPAASEARRRH